MNPEFASSDAAGIEARKYSVVIRRLPTILRTQVQTVWIHKGVQPFGGGNNNLLIHTGQADIYAADGILEETFVHEAAHTSLDSAHAASADWLSAQNSDPEFISTYARDNPTREDIAESFLPWLAVRHRSSRITAALALKITSAIPNRLAYFDTRSFNLYPILPRPVLKASVSGIAGGEVLLSWSTNAVGYKLQTRTPVIGSVIWRDSADTPRVVEGRFTVTNVAIDATRSYRLRIP